MEDYLSELKYSDLTEEQQLLVDCIGFEAFAKLIANFGGELIYVPMMKRLTAKTRNRKILQDSEKLNQSQLAKKYGLSRAAICGIIKTTKEEINGGQ